jgi:hypothetical protein
MALDEGRVIYRETTDETIKRRRGL